MNYFPEDKEYIIDYRRYTLIHQMDKDIFNKCSSILINSFIVKLQEMNRYNIDDIKAVVICDDPIMVRRNRCAWYGFIVLDTGDICSSIDVKLKLTFPSIEWPEKVCEITYEKYKKYADREVYAAAKVIEARLIEAIKHNYQPLHEQEIENLLTEIEENNANNLSS